jgi:hypothetical protein
VANHLRRQIREGVAAAITGLATTGANVFQSRVYPLQTTDLPALLVHTDSETSEVLTIHSPRELQRRVEVRVVAVAKAAADLDDTLDQIAKEVEVALAMPVSALAGIAKEITLTAISIDMQGSAEQPVGALTMTYQADYFTAENAPDVAL